jgi:ABC-type uncharacterized transport system substrate-binding protein
MKVYYSNDFHGHYPVGASAIVRADNLQEATELITKALQEAGLEFNGTLTEFKGKGVVVLQDGDY